MLKKQIAEIPGETNALFRKHCPDILIDGELSTEANGIVAKNPKCRRAKENLVCLCVRNATIRLPESVGAFSD